MCEAMENMKKGIFLALVVIMAIGAYASRTQASMGNAGRLFQDGISGIYETFVESLANGNAIILAAAVPFLFLLWRLVKLVLYPNR